MLRNKMLLRAIDICSVSFLVLFFVAIAMAPFDQAKGIKPKNALSIKILLFDMFPFVFGIIWLAWRNRNFGSKMRQYRIEHPGLYLLSLFISALVFAAVYITYYQSCLRLTSGGVHGHAL
jgi:hypothetical protein